MIHDGKRLGQSNGISKHNNSKENISQTIGKRKRPWTSRRTK